MHYLHTLCSDFRVVARLIFQRMKELKQSAIQHFWSKTTLELYKYLTLRRL